MTVQEPEEVARDEYAIVLRNGTEAAQVERLSELAHSLLEQNAQLREALESRIAIEQAKGVLAERFGLDIDDAFTLLRFAARSSHQKLHALAGEVVSSRETPAAVERWLERRQGSS